MVFSYTYDVIQTTTGNPEIGEEICTEIRSKASPNTFHAKAYALKLPADNGVPLYAANRSTARALRKLADVYDDMAEMSLGGLKLNLGVSTTEPAETRVARLYPGLS